MAHSEILRIFWPSDAPRNNRPGSVIGWRNSDLDVFVVAILKDVEVSLRSRTPRISLILTQ